MELLKKNIHMNRWKGNVSTQLTLDDDFIVPDTMDDMEQVVLDTGEIQLESVKNQAEKVVVRGKLEFKVLYRRSEGGLQALGGSISFEETVNVPGLEEKDSVQVGWDLEDLNAGIINSRKLSVKAMITLDVKVETLYDVEAAYDVGAGMPGIMGDEVKVESLKRSADVAAIAVRRKDTYRIKEEIQLTGNKPNIDNILWSEMRLRGVNSRPLDGKVRVEGELLIFMIYTSDGEHTPMQWMEELLPFSGELELAEAVEEMIPVISVRLLHKEMEAKPDYDGEMREIEVDAVLELDMKLYEEQKIDLLSDLYSTNRELVLQTGEACFDQILAKNMSKCKVSEKMKIDGSDRILQICHSEGNVKIDEVEQKEDGIVVDGVLEVQLLYLTADDDEPVKSSTEVVPFHYMVDVKGIDQKSVYQMTSGLEQLTAVMLSGDMVEIKAVISLDVLVLQPVREPVIISAVVEPMDMQKIQQMPGIVGYIVQQGDSLWKIAKKFHTTVDNVMMTNALTDASIKPGDRLILVKEVAR